jgi:hypothetical protein
MDAAKTNVKISFQQIIAAVKQLTPKEKLELNQVIWEGDIDIPIEHQNLVRARIENAKKNPHTMLDWDEASKTLVP